MIELANKTFVLDNNEKYAVIESIVIENKIYVYLVNIEDEMDSLFMEVKTDNQELNLIEIDKAIFEEKILSAFIDKLRKD